MNLLDQPQLFAFGFSNLAMLGWLAAAAAPLLIHLWSRRRYREVSWAAVDFLLAAMRKNARRLQLEQWLLLALRTLIIVLVVLAVAEPYTDELLAGAGTRPAHKVLVLDGSYSMAYRDGDDSLFSRAKQLAAELVRNSGSGDVFTLILMGHPARTIVDREVADRATIDREIESLEQTHAAADLASALTAVAESLQGRKGRSPSINRHEIYFFTDLQRATWLPASRALGPRGDALSSRSTGDNPFALDASIEALSKQAQLMIVDVSPPSRNNLAVTAISSPEPYFTLNQDVSFEATLHEYGDAPRNDLNVELLVDDVPVAEQTVNVPAGGDANVRFAHRFRLPRDHTVTIRAARDSLELDNVRSLAAPVREELRVLCVAGKSGGARYIADALDPDPTDSSPIQPTIASESDLPELKLDDFDCIFLTNVAQLTPGEADRLTRYVEQGGGVVFFLGDQVLPDQYNTLVSSAREAEQRGGDDRRGQSSPSLDSRQLLPARVGEVVTDPQFGLDPLDYRHPIVAPFRGRERTGLLTTPVTRYYQLETLAPAAEVVLATKNGNPFIVAEQIGRGRSMLVATDGSLSSVDPHSGEPWTAWPTWPSFLPIVRELLNYAIRGESDERQQLVGTPLSGTLRAAPANDLVRIARPDGRTDSIRVTNSSADAQWQYDRTNLSGIYRLIAADTDESASAQQRFAVNVDTAESDLAKVSRDDLPPALTVRDTWQDVNRGVSSAVASRGALHGSLLWLAVGLLLLEALAAWRFGRGVV